MGIAKKPTKVKLIAGFIFGESCACQKVMPFLVKKFGPLDFESEMLSFDRTDYYKDELGGGLNRKFVSFKKLIPPESLPAVKNFTNKIEKKTSRAKKRTVNIDPGYLDLAKLVLATTKDYAHRIYLSGGIYAEVTLKYQDRTFQPWVWTYPDYCSSDYVEIFNHIRRLYIRQVT